MAPPSVSTRYYNALLTTTLENWLKTNAQDQIATSNSFLLTLMRKPNGYKTISSLGERATIPLRYELGTPDSYSDYDPLKNKPYDGLTRVFEEWRQMSDAVMISGMEQAKNSGEEAVMNLLEEKKDQVMDGAKEFFAKAVIQGQGIVDGSSLQQPYTSAANGSLFVVPMFQFIAKDPTTAVSVSNIDQSKYAWWRNKVLQSTAASYADFEKEIDKLHMDCSKGSGGVPDLCLCDENVFRLYVAALRSFHRNPSYQVADLPFENVSLKGKPLVWDEFMPDVDGGSTTLDPASGTLVMINTDTFQVQAHSSTNFRPTEFRQPTNQDAIVSHVMWKGALVCSARRKNGVMFKIATTISS